MCATQRWDGVWGCSWDAGVHSVAWAWASGFPRCSAFSSLLWFGVWVFVVPFCRFLFLRFEPDFSCCSLGGWALVSGGGVGCVRYCCCRAAVPPAVLPASLPFSV